MTNQTIRKNFIYPTIEHAQRVFGATHSIGAVINESGDWREKIPNPELQKRKIETSACYIFAQTHTVASILELQYSISDSDFSERFNALLSNGTEYGGDPIAGAISFQNDGLVKQESMPFDDSIESWNDFHSWKGVNQEDCLLEGQEFKKQWKLNYGIAFEKDHPIEMKYQALREYLKRSPVDISVYGAVDANQNYIPKQSWMSDTHMVEALYVDDENCIWIFDTYEPFIKKLPKNYNPDFGLFWGITKIEKTEDPWWLRLYKWFFVEKLIYREFKKYLINLNNAKK